MAGIDVRVCVCEYVSVCGCVWDLVHVRKCTCQ